MHQPVDQRCDKEQQSARYRQQPEAEGEAAERRGDRHTGLAAHWLRARELPQGSHIALISKNCAHWIIADLAGFDVPVQRACVMVALVLLWRMRFRLCARDGA